MTANANALPDNNLKSATRMLHDLMKHSSDYEQALGRVYLWKHKMRQLDTIRGPISYYGNVIQQEMTRSPSVARDYSHIAPYDYPIRGRECAVPTAYSFVRASRTGPDNTNKSDALDSQNAMPTNDVLQDQQSQARQIRHRAPTHSDNGSAQADGPRIIKQIAAPSWHQTLDSFDRSPLKSSSVETHTHPPSEDFRGWSQALDTQLKRAIEAQRSAGTSPIQWTKIAKLLQVKTASQCQARWAEVLDDRMTKGRWSSVEDRSLVTQYSHYGPQWSKIAAELATRTSRQCRSRWLQLQARIQSLPDSEHACV